MLPIATRNALPETATLADLRSGAAHSPPIADQGLQPLSLAALQECGAFPVSEAEIRSRDLKRAERQFSAAVAVDSKPLEETRGHRLLSAYRLICAAARVVGDMPTGPAMMASTISPQKFYVPEQGAAGGVTQGTYKSFLCFKAIADSEDPYSFLIDGNVETHSGLTYLPPPIPDRFYSSQAEAANRHLLPSPKDYSPEKDRNLTLWLKGMYHLSEFLGLERGTDLKPQTGIYGLAGMFDPRTARAVWPSRDDLLNFEQELLFFIGDKNLSSWKKEGPEKEIMRDFGVTRVEALLLRKTADLFQNAMYRENNEDVRYREIQRLEALAGACMEAGDPRAALAADKQKHLVMGLTKNSEADSMQEFREEARSLLDEPSKKKDSLFE